MKIKYTIHRLSDLVFEIIVPDSYDRAMLFLRPQEYMESPNPKFRQHSFDIWDFAKWYSSIESPNAGFTYATDWSGFNFPLIEAIKCYEKLPDKYLTDYDLVFMKILKQILARVNKEDIPRVYIISYDKKGSVVMYHERYHACYYTNPIYKRVADKLLETIPKQTKNQLIQNLKEMGYHLSVLKNEIQAYLRGKDWSSPAVWKGIDRDTLRRVHQRYDRELSKVKCCF